MMILPFPNELIMSNTSSLAIAGQNLAKCLDNQAWVLAILQIKIPPPPKKNPQKTKTKKQTNKKTPKNPHQTTNIQQYVSYKQVHYVCHHFAKCVLVITFEP